MFNAEEIVERILAAERPELVINEIEWNEELGSNIAIQKALAHAIQYERDESTVYRIVMEIENTEALMGCHEIIDAVLHSGVMESMVGYEPGDEYRAECQYDDKLRLMIRAISKFESLMKDPDIKKIVKRMKRDIIHKTKERI